MESTNFQYPHTLREKRNHWNNFGQIEIFHLENHHSTWPFTVDSFPPKPTQALPLKSLVPASDQARPWKINPTIGEVPTCTADRFSILRPENWAKFFGMVQSFQLVGDVDQNLRSL